MDKSRPEQQCPLCGADNQCGMAAAEPPANCWCQSVSISEDVLAAIPVADRGVRCICPACARLETGGTDK